MTVQWHNPENLPESLLKMAVARCPENLVKKNPRRIVFRSGGYFVKREKTNLLSIVFRRKACREFQIAAELEKKNVPCVHYAAFGIDWLNSETILITKAEHNTVPLRDFFFDPENRCPGKRDACVAALRRLLAALHSNFVRHPDFHAGNILVDKTDGSHPKLVDLAGISFGTFPQDDALAHLAVDLLPVITETEALALLNTLGNVPDKLFEQARRRLFVLVDREWEKRRVPQILSGNSKFSHTETHDGRTFEIASDFCFRPGVFRDPDSLNAEKLPHAEAEKKWLDMFRARLEGRWPEVNYLMRERVGDYDILYGYLY